MTDEVLVMPIVDAINKDIPGVYEGPWGELWGGGPSAFESKPLHSNEDALMKTAEGSICCSLGNLSEEYEPTGEFDEQGFEIWRKRPVP